MLEREDLAKRIVNIDLKQKEKKKRIKNLHRAIVICESSRVQHEFAFSMYTKHMSYAKRDPRRSGDFR